MNDLYEIDRRLFFTQLCAAVATAALIGSNLKAEIQSPTPLENTPRSSELSGKEMPTQDLNHDLVAGAKAGDTATVRALLGKGAEVNSKDTNGQTPLMLASSTIDHSETVEALLSAGADINAQDIAGADGVNGGGHGPQCRCDASFAR